ncbi:hypothetical protein [Paraburkholderia sp. J10-1]|nr:hypothetical protein [Paraburkholderia sp. J10-1]
MVGAAETVLMRAAIDYLLPARHLVMIHGRWLPGVGSEHDHFVRTCRRTLHCNSSERLNRKAQCEEQDEE